MNRFAADGTLGVSSTFVAMAAIYFAFMMFGAFLIRQFLMSLPHEFEEAARLRDEVKRL